jgi:deoxyribonuclease-4
MLPDGRRLGAHLPLGGGMVAAVERAQAIGLDTLQIFSDNPTAWRRRAEPPRELGAFRTRLADVGLGPIAIHASYLVNLAGPDDAFHLKSVDVLHHELTVAPSFGARFVNVHTGSHKGSGLDGGIARIAHGIATLLQDVPQGPDAAVLVLENSAGGGGGIGVDVDEIAALLGAIAANGIAPERVGICLDTAHLWGAGHPIDTADGVDRLVGELGDRVGIERVVMIHLNDSKAMLGSRTDRHEHLGAGAIGAPGLARILTHPDLRHVTYYLETPGMDEGYDAVNASRARDLAEGRPLTSLPPEALNLPGSRARTGPSVEPAIGPAIGPGSAELAG